MKGYVTIEDGCVPSSRERLPLVSMIVPVYNTERYLDQALASLEAQTLKNFEILCVNDGSTDGSLEIMKDHAERDKRVRIVNKPNGGYGSACNRGLDEARGMWIGILEPDDWIEPGMLKDLTSFAGRFAADIDIVKSPYWRIWLPDTPKQRKINCSYRNRIKPSAQPFQITDPGVVDILCHHPSIWSALYKKSFLDEFSIRFPEIPGAGWADNPFLAETMSLARNIVYLDKPYYCYREETPEKAQAFAHRNTLLPIERWHDMLDTYERVGMRDKGVMRAHNSRGFTYISGIIEEVDLSHEEVYNAALSVFERMDDLLVFSDPEISPGWKKKYAEMKGVQAPPPNYLQYAWGLMKAGAYNLKNTGVVQTFEATGNYLSKHRRREGR